MASYYNDEKNVASYIKMAEGYNGRELIDLLRQHLPTEATVLELGMGPGTDLDILRQHFQATGSDYSQVFLDRYLAKHPTADVLRLDAVEMNTERRFDAIYSNKVLYHLTREQLKRSLQAQANVLNTRGLLCHSFWAGEGEEEMHGLHFAYYTEASLREVIGREYEVLAIKPYAEMEADDSLCLLLQKR